LPTQQQQQQPQQPHLHTVETLNGLANALQNIINNTSSSVDSTVHASSLPPNELFPSRGLNFVSITFVEIILRC
jgi:hypothetical protein